ncbi:MAG: hypothetical protein ACR2HG_02435 [Pyrinomonadaceae bacterium]
MKRNYVNDNYKNIEETKAAGDSGERGSALVIALMVMILLLGFVALAVTRTTNETIASSNDAAESRTFEAANASLEVMTRNFNKIFDVKLNPAPGDLTNIINNTPPGFDDYTFKQDIIQTQAPKQVISNRPEFAGLTASQDEWLVSTTATDQSGVQVALHRKFYNNRIPIFQFGIFYDHDLEFHPGPRFDFGGRVHSNGNLFLMAGTGLYFSSKVTAVGQIFTDVARNGNPWTNWNENVFVRNGSGTYVQLKHDMGSVLQNPVNGSPFYNNPDLPTVYKNDNWQTNQDLFDGNLQHVKNNLNLPIKIASNIAGTTIDYVELIKRGKNIGDLFNNGTFVAPVTAANADDEITGKERYYNKTGIRVSIADTKAKLPGCASGTLLTPVAGNCGVNLTQLTGGAYGYKPAAMTDGYQATEINGERFNLNDPTKDFWIKIETVGLDTTTNLSVTKDITEDILSLGVTEPPPSQGTDFSVSGYGDCAASDANPDCRSVIKLQRFVMKDTLMTSDSYLTANTITGNKYNYIVADSTIDLLEINSGFLDNPAHKKPATITNQVGRKIVAFPINMFDTREGLYNDNLDTNATYGSNVPWNGVMSMVDVDVANLRRFLSGNFNGRMPAGTPFALAQAPARGLLSTDIPDANGWVLYVSDRRGDYDFDGEYDMEDIYGNNDDILQPGEDINNNGILDRDYFNFEAPKYTKNGLFSSLLTPNSFVQPSIAATLEHKFYRRGVRLINGQTLPGNYDSANPNNTHGFTLASENGVYVKGNYNAYGINSVGSPTPADDYLPHDTVNHIPASIVGDAVTILSNKWNDAESFRYPFNLGQRNASETYDRFAMLAGDARSSLNGNPNQGGGDTRLTGGVHNFKRFLEDWGGTRMNYAGSLINLFNSHNNNGAFKCCNKVYSPPTRNWVFDTSFLDPNRLPPGTPFFQFVQLTGFQRLN